MSLLNELRRRNVFRAAIAYIVVAWLILQVADVVLNNIQAPQQIFQILLLLLALGLPLVLVISWIFELTPDGFKREDEIDRSQTETTARSAGREIDFAIIALLLVALGYFAYDKFVLSDKRQTTMEQRAETTSASGTPGNLSTPDISIAVLPFINLTSDAEQEYFSDGLSEELLNLLARIPELRVIARTSSFSYKGKDTNIAELSRELKVAHVLEGSVRRSADTLRIGAQLIRAEDSSQIWSQTYDRKLDDIFAIQDDIAAAVVTQLKLRLLGAVPTARETNHKAYRLYLQARDLSRQGTAKGHERSIDLYNQVLQVAPDYPPAWTGLAENYISLAGKSLMPIDDGYALAREAANKALKLDPEYGVAHASLGRIAMVHDNDLAAAARHLERALELDPTNPQVIRPAAILAMNLLRLNDAIALLEYGVQRDPISSALHSNLALGYFSAGRPDEAVAEYRTSLSLSPEAVGVRSFIGQALLAINDTAAALAEMQQEPSEPWRLIGLTMVHHALGQASESDNNLQTLIQKYGDEWPYNIAYVVAYRGETERTFEWLEKAKKYNDPGLSEIVAAPEFANVSSDHRWLPFLESIGKAPEQLAAIEFRVSRRD